MTFNYFRQRSIRTRIAVFTLLVLLASVWSVTFYASRILRDELQNQISDQQFSTVSLVAMEIEHELKDRLEALELLASQVNPDFFNNTAALQSLLEQRLLLTKLFSGGTFFTRLDGVATASVPLTVNRLGIDYLDRDYIAATLQQGKASIGHPVVGKAVDGPVLGMAVPVRDAHGKLIGALAGVVTLSQGNFLQELTAKRYGKSGSYLIVAPQHQLIVTATNQGLTMTPLPVAAGNPILERYAKGYEGTDILRNPDDLEVLSSVKSIPSADWYLRLNIPTAEVFAPIQAVQQRIFLVTLLMTLFMTSLIWWMLRHYLAPLQKSVRALTLEFQNSLPAQALAVTRPDEIGQLIEGFNRLLQKLNQRESLLRHIFDTSTVAIFVFDKQGCITQANQHMASMFGCSLAQLIGQDYLLLVHPTEREEAEQKIQALLSGGTESLSLNRLYRRRDQSSFRGRLDIKRFPDTQGEEVGLIGVIADVTESWNARQFEQFRSQILELLVGNTPLAGILQALAAGIEKIDPEMACKVFLLSKEKQKLELVAAPSLTDIFSTALDGLAVGPGSGSSGTAAFSGKRVVVQDISSHPDWAGFKDLAAKAGWGACWAQPIQSSTGQVLGTIDICHRTVHAPGQAEISLIEQAARLASIAIERSLSAQAIRESESRFRSLMEDVPGVAVQGYALDGTVQFWNKASESLYGYSATEALGDNLLNLIIPEAMHEGVRQAIQQMIDTGVTIPAAEMLLRTKQNTLVPVFSSHALVHSVSGEAELFCIDIDLTQRKQFEVMLREKEELYRDVVDHGQALIWLAGPHKEVFFFNQPALSFTGKTLKQELGMGWVESVHPDDVAPSMQIYEEAFERREPFSMIYRLRRHDGEYRWILEDGAPRHDSAQNFVGYVGHCLDITERKQADEEIQRLAFYDVLTGLPNRRLLLDRLRQALTSSVRHQRLAALLFIDMDDFKTLNDTLGHANGDLLLQQVARRLTNCIRESDTVARLGGDEFVVMLEDLSSTERLAATQVETVGDKILSELGKTYFLADAERHCTCSIGITLFGDKQENSEEPLKRADLAMYQAKMTGRNALRFFDPKMQAEVSARAAMEMEIREGLEKQHFVLYYQAQVADGHRITGAEVLLRWSHPVRGLELPANFITLAEETGLIFPLGQWVLESACTQLALWASQPALADLTVAVNVSARQFHQADFVDQVLATLERTGARAQRLRLELTESVMVRNVEAVIVKMRTLKALGVGFAMDDFGTGYSSLSYLKRLPLDELKIDQGFVRDILIDPDDAAIARMVIALAASMNLLIIAEGVETEAQRDFLSALGCHNYQGYLFSRPVPVQEFEALVTPT